jgi:hypothetical protein
MAAIQIACAYILLADMRDLHNLPPTTPPVAAYCPPRRQTPALLGLAYRAPWDA